MSKFRIQNTRVPDVTSAAVSVEAIQFVVLQKLRHFTRKAFRFPRWRKTRSHGASPINQELREVPFYTVAQQPTLLLLKPNVEGVGVLAVDLDLGEQRESYPIGSVAEGSDLRV